MTKEQIEQKAREIANFQKTRAFGIEDIYACCFIGCKEMADWLLDNLWISVEDELPPFDKVVIVHYDNDDMVGEMFSTRTEDINVIKDNHDFCIYCDEKITHWMPIPKLNKK